MEQLILEGVLEAKNIKRGDDGRLRFEGVALRFNTLSANSWFYGENMVRESVERTNRWIAEGNICTMYATHGKALGSMFSLPTESPIGKYTEFFLEDDKMMYRGQISPTEEGKDIMTLIEDGVIIHTSIRSNMFEAEPVTMSINGEDVEVMAVQHAIINGVDFCDQPGVAGAGITKIFESAPTFVTHSEDNMDMKELTLEALRAERPDLLNAAVVEHLALFQGQIQEKDAEIARLTEELAAVKEGQIDPETVTALETQLQESGSLLAETQAELALWEEVAVPLVKKMVELRKEDPSKDMNTVRVEALASLHAESGIGDQGSGAQTDEPENDSLEVVEGAPESFASLIEITSQLGR